MTVLPESRSFVESKNRTPHTCVFKKTLARYLENYAGFSETNITQTVVGLGLYVSPQRFAVLLTPALFLVSAYYSLNWWNISMSQGKKLVSNMFLFFRTHKNNILSHVNKNYETVKTKTKRKKEIRLCNRLIVLRNPQIFVTNLFDHEFLNQCNSAFISISNFHQISRFYHQRVLR